MPVKNLLKKIKNQTIEPYKKKQLAKSMQQKHKQLLTDLQGKERIRVVFLAIHKSIWKVDPIFQKMLIDPLFEPEILVCPYIVYGEERMLEDMEQAYSYFLEKGYPVRKSLKKDGSWVKLEEIKPDIVFFTNPYDLTRKEYYEDAYLNYLSCYVPYYFMATKHSGEELNQYSNILFLLAWRIYWPHDYCDSLHKKLSINKGVNGLTLGYPATERLYLNKSLGLKEFWKNQPSSTKKIIYAPHHTISDSKYSLSSFLMFGEFIKELAEANEGKIQWSFKPHPILKSKLYVHPEWGQKRTDAYYEFWGGQPYTQLDEGEYDGLFLSSDAIIHDCSSFIVEYAFTGKPCLYLVNKNSLKGLLNDFGEGVMQVYEQAKSIEEIKTFVCNVVNGTIKTDQNKRAYFDSYVDKYYKEKLPSERIIEDIKQTLGAYK